jgi:hypothetical protein
MVELLIDSSIGHLIKKLSTIINHPLIVIPGAAYFIINITVLINANEQATELICKYENPYATVIQSGVVEVSIAKDINDNRTLELSNVMTIKCTTDFKKEQKENVVLMLDTDYFTIKRGVISGYPFYLNLFGGDFKTTRENVTKLKIKSKEDFLKRIKMPGGKIIGGRYIFKGIDAKNK